MSPLRTEEGEVKDLGEGQGFYLVYRDKIPQFIVFASSRDMALVKAKEIGPGFLGPVLKISRRDALAGRSRYPFLFCPHVEEP